MIYEFPLTEGIRRFLRIEMLAEQSLVYIEQDSEYSTIAAVRALLDLVSLVSKNDTKIELIKQLDQVMLIESLSEADRLEANELKGILSRQSFRAYDAIKENVFLNTLRQRFVIVGGICAFDLPVLHNWLNMPFQTRKEHFYEWMAVIENVMNAVHFVLRCIRGSMVTEECSFKHGFYYRSVKWRAGLLRINMNDYNFFPEFSGNRHQLSIRLVEQSSPWDPPKQVDTDITLQVEICGA
ncbi:cell division protein ZapD [Ignatzschineria rhizosphaerae]|uniref:Cell division protein ZapD n=1 Tax=Ignatzschineria rhizosphaerae TaxID=2923279 RepID=A0ABY3X0W2_9GAMM|nr:cell division protein ZapD [Ignatzschineria rhizosphaerae]UNM96503.1 cell division protein ZapD [Ignatzschineria rhizosphaerae]